MPEPGGATRGASAPASPACPPRRPGPARCAVGSAGSGSGSSPCHSGWGDRKSPGSADARPCPREGLRGHTRGLHRLCWGESRTGREQKTPTPGAEEVAPTPLSLDTRAAAAQAAHTHAPAPTTPSTGCRQTQDSRPHPWSPNLPKTPQPPLGARGGRCASRCRVTRVRSAARALPCVRTSACRAAPCTPCSLAPRSVQARQEGLSRPRCRHRRAATRSARPGGRRQLCPQPGARGSAPAERLRGCLLWLELPNGARSSRIAGSHAKF